MKKRILPIIAFCSIFCGFSNLYAQWSVVGSASFSPGPVRWTSLAIGASDIPYLAFMDNSTNGNGRVTVMKYENNTWQNVGAPHFSTNAVGYVVLTTDKNRDTLYLAYIDAVIGVVVNKWNGSSWVNVGTPGFIHGQQDALGMVVSSTGVPFITYRDANQTNKASVMQYADTGWTYVDTANFSPFAIDYVALGLDNNGVPYVGEINSNQALIFVEKFNGSHFDTLGGYRITQSNRGANLSLAFDSINTPYIANIQSALYPDAWKYLDGQWNEVVPGGAINTFGAFVGLLISPQGAPIVAYSDTYNGGPASVSYFKNGQWYGLGNSDFSGGEADFVTMSMNSHGDVYVAYEDYASGYGPTVMKYSATTSVNSINSPSDIKIYPNPCNGRFEIVFTATDNDNAQLTLVNSLGQIIWQKVVEQSNGKFTVQVNTAQYAPGIYTLRIKTKEGFQNQLVEIM